jgi:hypothetical protein
VCQKQTLPLFTNNQVAAFDHCSGPDLNWLLKELHSSQNSNSTEMLLR